MKKYRNFDSDVLRETKELLVPNHLGDHLVNLVCGIGLGELSLLGIGNIHRACSAVANQASYMLMIEPILYKTFLRAEHLKIMNIREKIDSILSVFAFSHWLQSDVTNLAVRSSSFRTSSVSMTLLSQYKTVAVDFPKGGMLANVGDSLKELILVMTSSQNKANFILN